MLLADLWKEEENAMDIGQGCCLMHGAKDEI